MQEVRFNVGAEALHGEHHAAQPPVRGALVLVHGFNSCTIEFHDTPQRLAARGFHVLTFDQRGFGRSDGERGLTDDERAVADIEAATAWLKATAPGVPLGIVGHSLGGLYAAAAMARPHPFKAAVLAHPVDCMFDELGLVKAGAYHVLGRWSEKRRAKGKPSGSVPYATSSKELFVSDEARREAKRPKWLMKRANLANYRAAVRMHASQFAPFVTIPTLYIGSPLDKAVHPHHSMQVFRLLGGPKQMVQHQGGHSCFRDLDGPFVAQAIADWFTVHLGAKRPLG